MKGVPVENTSGFTTSTTPVSGEPAQDRILVKIDPDLAELIPGYLARRHEDCGTMKKALLCSDYETIRLLGHSMKGSGGGYGFQWISAIGLSLEEAAKVRDEEGILEGIRKLTGYLDLVEVEYG